MDFRRMCVWMLVMMAWVSPSSFADGTRTPDCDNALATCADTCDSPVPDESGQSRADQASDFKDKCRTSCQEGFRTCQVQDSKLGCDTFAFHCGAACPWTYMIGSEQVEDEEILRQCLKACHKGKRSCQVDYDQIPPRERSASFDVCAEAQLACSVVCIKEKTGDGLNRCLGGCMDGRDVCTAELTLFKCESFAKNCNARCPPQDGEDDEYLEGMGGESMCDHPCGTGREYCRALIKQ